MPIFSFLSFLSFFLSFYSFFSSILFRIRHLCSCPKEVTSNTFRPWDNIVRVFSYHRRFPFYCSQNRLLPSPASPRSSFPLLSSLLFFSFFFFSYFWVGGGGGFLFSVWSVGTLQGKARQGRGGGSKGGSKVRREEGRKEGRKERGKLHGHYLLLVLLSLGSSLSIYPLYHFSLPTEGNGQRWRKPPSVFCHFEDFFFFFFCFFVLLIRWVRWGLAFSLFF